MFEAAYKKGLLGKTQRGDYYVPGALKDLSISRSSFTWGIPVPEPAASAAAQKHVIYVWLDALANYMTAIGYGSDDPAEQAKFEKYWPADLHLVGKEIIRFHCVYWPAFLLAAGLPLPKAITAHGWLLFEDSKMSKSKGNIVRTETILDAFGTLCPPKPLTPTTDTVILSGAHSAESKNPEGAGPATTAGTLSTENPTKADRDLFASDVLRYFLLREIPFGQDGSFSFDALITRYNADLVNGYGNLVSRTLSMVYRYRDGLIPAASESQGTVKFRTTNADGSTDDYDLPDNALHLISVASELIVREAFNKLQFTAPLNEKPQNYELDFSKGQRNLGVIDSILWLVDSTNDYITQNAPWKLSNVDETQLDIVLDSACQSIRYITALLYPVLPYATARVWAQLGLGDIELAARNGELKNLEWGGLKPGTKLGPLGPIFPRADKGLAQIMTDMENPTPLEPASEPTSTTDPAAPPRTTSIAEPTGALPVGGSTAHTTGPDSTPSHTEIPASGIFANQPTPPATHNPQPTTPHITIDDFAKVELRVAQVLVAERIPKADKLLRLEVDLGPDFPRRQILSGIAEWYTPEDLIGRRIVVITNLAPRKMRGLESHGMLLAASNGEGGKPVLATFSEDIALGSRLK
jgi:methionyl-tRNA synthetase